MAGNAEDKPVEITISHGVTGWFESGVYFYFEPWSYSRYEFVCGINGINTIFDHTMDCMKKIIISFLSLNGRCEWASNHNH